MRTCTRVCVATLLLATAGLAGCGSNDSNAPATEAASAGAESAGSGSNQLRLVAIGDSIPYNSSNDCPGCTGFVDRYAKAVEQATGQSVEVENLSQHNSLTLPLLLDEIESFHDDLAAADVIVVGIAHNSMELNTDRPCGAPRAGDLPPWAATDEACAVRSAEEARTLYDRLYSRIAAWREGKPTILRTIDRYNDWIGWADGHLTSSQERLTAVFIGEWNAVLCESAEANGFGCADISKAFNGPDGVKPSGDLLAADYTHPSEKGNALIARTLAELGFAPLA
ncbi:MAG: hypothetical protein QOJ13_2229 [Gaiellales bacterium]|nr:hypothetical protein [Gaiellales bacterium]